MMARRFTALALIVSAFFALTLALIRARPYDDSALRGLLADDRSAACAPPCWQGIQPGITSVDVALATLEAHPWVGSIDGESETRLILSGGYVRWRWNGGQPAALGDDNFLYISSGVVRVIHLDTRIPFGDVWLHYGQPPYGYIAFMRGAMLHHLLYTDAELQAILLARCPTTLRAFWEAGVSFEFSARATLQGPYNLLAWLPVC